jgi:hypothetical protein
MCKERRRRWYTSNEMPSTDEKIGGTGNSSLDLTEQKEVRSACCCNWREVC